MWSRRKKRNIKLFNKQDLIIYLLFIFYSFKCESLKGRWFSTTKEARLKGDIFRKLIEEGTLKTSGLNKDFNSYRIFEYQGKSFKLTLKEVEEQ